jgi:hypothetical protein
MSDLPTLACVQEACRLKLLGWTDATIAAQLGVCPHCIEDLFAGLVSRMLWRPSISDEDAPPRPPQAG